ncbi:MAG: hypothetical protein K0S54_1132 [Alphaproteobacteria bacterium]|jgi:hypothetical protein|nr:hypothetical protein [Alphaproteobacteria bacterium]
MTIIISSASNAAASSGIPVEDLLVRLDRLMNDEDRTRWTEEERIGWFNDAAAEIVLRRPAARAVTEVMELVGGTFQQCSEGAAQLLNVVRNIKATGTGGRVISIVDQQALNASDPDWHSAKARETRHYMIDERSPTTFYVYPPAVSGAKVEVLVSKAPPQVANAADTLDIRPEFTNAIINWALYRCHTKDDEVANGAVATIHYQAFTDAIGAPSQAAQVNSATGNSV